MSTVHVTFEHLRYEFPDEQLIRYGSPYFDVKSAGTDLLGFFGSGASSVSRHVIDFDSRHILCANESFPEAALADPLAGLEVWDDWRSRLRAFPYPGTGLYAQAGIAPWVLVRVIRHWPDFIFGIGGDRYAFVEVKAFTSLDNRGSTRGIPNSLLGDCLVFSVQQLNAEPFVLIWGASHGQ